MEYATPIRDFSKILTMLFVFMQSSKAESSYILSFDWSGKFLKSFVCTGEIKDLRVIPEENTIYATEKIDDKIKLFKLVIDEQ